MTHATKIFKIIVFHKPLNRITPTEHLTGSDGQVAEYIRVIERYSEAFRDAVNALDDRYIEEIADALHAAKRVSFYSFGYCSMELHLQINLMLDGKETILCQRFADQLNDIQRLDKDSMMVIIAPDNLDSVETALLLAGAEDKGAKTLIITDTPMTDNRKSADYFLSFAGAGNAVDIHFLYMFVDIINVCYRSKYIDTKSSLLHLKD